MPAQTQRQLGTYWDWIMLQDNMRRLTAVVEEKAVRDFEVLAALRAGDILGGELFQALLM